MSRHRLVDAPRSDALLIAVLVGGVAALGAGAYWAIKATIDHQKADDATQATAAPAPRSAEPIEQPAATVPEPEPQQEPAPEPPPEPEPEPEPEADSLNRDDIVSVIGEVKSTIAACAERAPFSGVVRASVKVAANGRVTKVELDGDPPPKLERCMLGILRKLKFRRTSDGGSFRYPFNFLAG